MTLTLYLTICLMQIFSFANANGGKYTVIAPGTIHSNEKYTAAVSVHHTSQPCQIKIGITGPSYNEAKQVEVSQNEVKHVEFDLPSLEKGDYNLTAEGVNCFNNFKNSTKLIYNKFNNYIRIQTDRGFYKPGDDINFRVIFLDKDLRPAKPEKDAVIWFEDGKNNRIKEIRGFETKHGVYTSKFKVIDNPVTGSWHLGVTNGGRHDTTVYFEVNKYVQPKFVIKVEATNAVSVKDGDMQVIVKAEFTYGKPLDGKATVVLSLDSGGNSGAPTLIKIADMVSGQAKIDFNVKEYEGHLPHTNSPSYLSIVAIVEEKLTGVKINGTTSSTIYPYRYNINCLGYNSFDAGTEKNLQLLITHIDGSNLMDTKTPIELIYKKVLRKNPWWHSARNLDDDDDESKLVTTTEPPIPENFTISFIRHMNEQGLVNFNVSLPDLPIYEGYLHYYSREIKYLDEQREVCPPIGYLWLSRQPKKVDTSRKDEKNSKEYFILVEKHSLFNHLRLNQADQFTLNSSQPLSYFDYHVIGRGNILKSGRVDLPDKPKVFNLTLTPERLWAPYFYVYVYYVDEKGEYHYAEQRYNVDYELENQIKVTAARQVKPGAQVSLKIQTTPNSYVGLTAVDERVLMLRPNNDLNWYEFNSVLGSYTTNTPHQGGSSKYPGNISGCVTLTNANYFYNWTKPNAIPAEKCTTFLNPSTTNRVHVAVEDITAESSVAEGTAAAGNIQVRKDFSETWLFADIENTETDELEWTVKIPQSITTWYLTAFSMSSTKGLGLTSAQTRLRTFQPFFMSIRLPYSVKIGEIIKVPALVFNYLKEDLDVEVTLDNSDGEYDNLNFDNEVVRGPKLTKLVHVQAQKSNEVSFLIRPKVIGNVMLKFTAISPIAGDAMRKTIKVLPEGVTQYVNRAYFVNLKGKLEHNSSVKLELPEALVPDSQHVKVCVVGDFMGPILNKLDNLVIMPASCGEETVSYLWFNYLVMKYLLDSKRLTPTMEAKLRRNLETGFQNMLNYRHTDGSFSSFGPAQTKENSRNGSTWLTSYFVRFLSHFREFFNVNEKIIEKGLSYLIKQQAQNGTFIERNDASKRNHITLTSAAVLAFLEYPDYVQRYFQKINAGLAFIAKHIKKSDTYAQALGTYTLNKVTHSAAKRELNRQKSLAKTDSDRIWWSARKEPLGRRWYYDDNVEITSYNLLTLLDQDSTKVDEVIPIVKWLIAQRNKYGSFATTEDTVVGLTALIKFAKFANYEPAKMVVDIVSKDKKETIKLAEDNGIVYQCIEMPSKTNLIEFAAKGAGSALIQIAYQYNIFEKPPKPSFTIKTKIIFNQNRPLRLEMLVCVNYLGEGKSSNTTLLEISTPSGYVIDNEILKKINELKRVGKTELKRSDSLLIVYFDHLYENDEICLTVEALRTHAVAIQKSVPIRLYDYYDTSKQAIAFYDVDSKLCDNCETREECSNCK